MSKIKIVIIHSFASNSIILEGLYDYLRKYFDLYFVDLPGYLPDTFSDEVVSLNSQAEYVSKKINEMNLGEYWVGGICSGFIVANKISVDENCKGTIAIEPYIGKSFLKFSNPFIWFLIHSVLQLGRVKFIARKLWKSDFFQSKISTRDSSAKDITKQLTTLIDGYIVFSSIREMLEISVLKLNQYKPCLLVLNPLDKAMDSSKMVSYFTKSCEVHILETSAEHFPSEITQEYFEKNISEEDMLKTVERMS